MGSLAAIDLVRYLRLVDEAPEWAIPAVSVVSGLVAPGILLEGLTWGLFFSALAVFAPRLYPATSGLPREAWGFRVVVSLASLGIGVVLVYLSGLWMALAAVVGFLVAASALLGYLAVVRGWRLLDDDDPPVEPVESFAPFVAVRTEVRRDLRRTGLLGAIGSASWIGALAVVMTFPCLLAGIVVMVLYHAGPLPDVLVLVWVGAGMVDRLHPGVSSTTVPDLEKRLFGGIGETVGSVKGLTIGLYATLGLLLAAGHVFVVLTARESAFTSVGLLAERPVFASASLAPAICMMAAGVYGLWFWSRELRRIPAFLDQWSGDAARSVPARPPGLTFPVAVVAVVPVVLHGGLDEAVWTLPALGYGWPLLLLGLVGAAVGTERYGRRDVAREDHVVTICLIIQAVELWLLRAGWELGVLVDGGVPTTLVDPALPSVVVMLIAVSLLPDVLRYHETREGPVAAYGRSLYLVSFGGFVGVASGLVGAPLSILLLALAAVSVSGGVGLALVEYYDL